MGQKVHPGGLRVGVIHDWKSNWYVGKKEFATYILEDVRIREHITGKLSHADLTKYNYVQKLLYAGIIVVGILVVLSGLAIWKPVQLQYLTALFGGYDVTRYVHFFCMAAIVAFLVVHVALALLVPKSLRAMIIGR